MTKAVVFGSLQPVFYWFDLECTFGLSQIVSSGLRRMYFSFSQHVPVSESRKLALFDHRL